MIKFLDLPGQYAALRQEIDEAMGEVLRHGAYIGGRYIAAFEEEFAAYQRARHCVGVANGTDALEIALECLDLPPGSEVLVPANTFIASAEAVTRAGHRVVFVDCDPDTLLLSVEDAERRITPRTRAIVVVHLYGHPCDMDRIGDVARRHALRVVEDCAQAHGAEFRGQRVGTLGDVSTFSFYPGKNLGAYGDAGAILTNDADLARRCRMVANHGRTAKYDHLLEGRNSRLDGLQAAVLSVKLKYLDEWTARRIAVADQYRQLLAGLPGVRIPRQEPWAKHVYHLFVVRAEDRDRLRDELQAEGIEVGIHYPIALPELKAYAHLGQGDEFPAAKTAAREILSLPIGEHLDAADVARVAAAIEASVRNAQPIG